MDELMSLVMENLCTLVDTSRLSLSKDYLIDCFCKATSLVPIRARARISP